MTILKRTVIYVSDGTGITAETLGHGLLSQFEGIEFKPLRYPFLDSEDKARECVARINEVKQSEGVHPIVIMTQTNAEFSSILHQADAFFIDLFDTFIVPLEKELGSRYSRAVGRSHGQANPEYNSRIAAMNFALAHDDGVSDADLKSADIILVGVSRSGKTPTSLYLSLQFSLRAANYPLIPEDFERGHLPSRLQPFRGKLYGLTIDPEQLQRIRFERRPNSKYASLDNCRYEVAAAEKMMKREGIKWFDTTSRSIEELAVQLMQELNPGH
ncbi:MAG TPA: phosphoenolpyruvate synthase regulatory protein [Gallionellaceae bacterium]|nr:phosphoenolpyruvate synthase regulatory protein [Gallionellaceae bacterium]